MSAETESDLTRILAAFSGLRCWHVAAGAIGYAFSAQFGDKVRRSKPLLGDLGGRAPDEFEMYRGFASLMIWCPWRLDGPERPVSSSAEEKSAIEHNLQALVGLTISNAIVISKALDLVVEFSEGLTLGVFSEFTAEVNLGHNWSCHLGSAQCLAGPGFSWRIVAEPKM